MTTKIKVEILPADHSVGHDRYVRISDEFGVHDIPINRTSLARIIDACGEDEKLIARINAIDADPDVPKGEQVETDEQLDAQIAAIESRRKTARAARSQKTDDAPAAPRAPADDAPAKKKKSAKKKAKK